MLERNPFAKSFARASFQASLRVAPGDLVGADELCVACTRLTLVVGYPFDRSWSVDVVPSTADGFTRAELFRNVVLVYSSMYEGTTRRPVENMYNVVVTSPDFGVASHAIDDLVVDHVAIVVRDGVTYGWVEINS